MVRKLAPDDTAAASFCATVMPKSAGSISTSKSFERTIWLSSTCTAVTCPDILGAMETMWPAMKASSVDSCVNTSTRYAMPKYSSTASATAAGQTSHMRFFGSGAAAGDGPASFINQKINAKTPRSKGAKFHADCCPCSAFSQDHRPARICRNAGLQPACGVLNQSATIGLTATQNRHHAGAPCLVAALRLCAFALKLSAVNYALWRTGVAAPEDGPAPPKILSSPSTAVSAP